MRDRGMSSTKGMLEGNKITEMFQAMVIVSLKMSNLSLKGVVIKNQITTTKEEK
jgi:hypothetical protein